MLLFGDVDLSFFQNPYVLVGGLVCILVILAKMFDQKQDARQAVYQDIADAFAKFGQDQFADAFKALARDGYERFFSILINVVDRLRKPGGVAEVLCTIVVKSLKDKDFLEDPQVAARLEPVLAEIALGFILDDDAQAELTRLSSVLSDYGSVEFSDLLANLGANRIKAAEMDFHKIIALLRNKDRLDDEFMARAKKLLPAIVKADPAHLAELKAIVDSITIPSAPATK